MLERQRFRPFTQDSERKVRMVDAPLALVLAQIRWPEHAKFARDFASLALDFGDGLEEFPLHDQFQETGVQITPDGVSQVSGNTAYRWRSVDGVWAVQLTKHFVSVYCTRHEGYTFAEFLRHFSRIAQLVQSALKVRAIDRVGVRYVDRISDQEVLNSLGNYFAPGILGFTPLQAPANVRLVSNFSQAMYSVDEIMVHARSGTLEPGATVDPVVTPLAEESWVLDVDAFVERAQTYDPEGVTAVVGRLADAAYDFFKFVLLSNAEERLDGVK